MKTLSASELRVLMEQQQGPCISLFLPTHRAGGDTQQDPLRLRQQLRAVENRLLLKDLRSTQVQALLEPIQALLDDEQFWLHRSSGLAVFRSPELLRAYWLPYPFKEQVIVTNHFYLKPLLPLATNDGRFYILALSQKEIRLLESTHYNVNEVELPEGVPHRLADAMKYKEPENELQYHSSSSGAVLGKGGRRATIFHGQGVGTDDEKQNILRYFQQVDRGLHARLGDEQVPLVLAGVEYLFPIYREANTYPHLLDEGVAGNPDRESAEALRTRAWAVVEPYFMRAREEAVASYRAYAGSERASNDLRVIIPAAYYGQIACLFVAADQEQWGTFNPATTTLHVHREPRFQDDELLDMAATQTLLHGGAVYVVEQAQMPDEKLLAAVFRY
jgi:hypothetical protein